MMTFFAENMASVWIAIGFVLLAVEALALGFGSGFVLFFGIAALFTGGLMYIGLVPQTWLAGIATFGLTSVLTTTLLWKPFKRLQANGDAPSGDNSSDWVGQEFNLEEEISFGNPGKRNYSGIEWRVELDESSQVDKLSAGTKVVVTSLAPGVFRVKAQTAE